MYRARQRFSYVGHMMPLFFLPLAGVSTIVVIQVLGTRTRNSRKIGSIVSKRARGEAKAIATEAKRILVCDGRPGIHAASTAWMASTAKKKCHKASRTRVRRTRPTYGGVDIDNP